MYKCFVIETTNEMTQMSMGEHADRSLNFMFKYSLNRLLVVFFFREITKNTHVYG